MGNNRKQLYTYQNEGFTFNVDSFQAEYARCGSHQIELRLDFDLEELNKFLEQLGIKPLKAIENFPPTEATQERKDSI